MHYICDVKSFDMADGIIDTLKYPIGIQSFSKIIEEGYAYVDKTSFIAKLVSDGQLRVFL